jgi:hypothetical protein
MVAGSVHGRRRPGAAAVEAMTACGRFETREKEVRAVSKPKYIHRLTDKYIWAVLASEFFKCCMEQIT